LRAETIGFRYARVGREPAPSDHHRGVCEARRRFSATIADAHPTKPIFAIDIFTSGKDLEADPKRAEYRAVVREAVARQKSDQVRHLDGRALFTDTRGLCFDLLHPSSEGFGEIASRLATEMQPTAQALFR
jgi:hypothetical protein